MLKKTLSYTALALVLISSTAQAGGREVPRDGFYVGLMTGLSQFSSNGQFTTPTAGGTTTVFGQKSSLSDTTWKTGGFLGYEENFSNNILLAGQILYTYNTLNTKTNVATANTVAKKAGGTISVKQSSTYGATVKVGIPLHDSIGAYATLGVVNSKFRLAHTPADPTNDGYAGTKKDKTSWGFAPGVELKVGLTHNISIHASYQYTLYQSAKADLTGTVTIAGTGHSTYKLTPRMSDFLVGVSYKI